MNKYIFKTVTTMKEYNNKKWWIDSGYIREIIINAANVREALKEYRNIVNNNYGVEISGNALKTKSPMYRDLNGETVQVGYVITGKTLFDKGDYSGYCTQYIDLWVEVLTVVNTDF